MANICLECAKAFRDVLEVGDVMLGVVGCSDCERQSSEDAFEGPVDSCETMPDPNSQEGRY